MKTGSINFSNIAINSTAGPLRDKINGSDFLFKAGEENEKFSIENNLVTVEGPSVWFSASDGVAAPMMIDSPLVDGSIIDILTVTWYQQAYKGVLESGSVFNTPWSIGGVGTNPVMLYYHGTPEYGYVRIFWDNGAGTRGDIVTGGSIGAERFSFESGWRQVVIDASDPSETSVTYREGPTVGDWVMEDSSIEPIGGGILLPTTNKISIGSLGYTVSNKFEGAIGQLTAVGDGILIAEQPEDTSDSSVTISYGSSGPTTLPISSGESRVINPDHTDTGNKISTGQGIVKRAGALFSGSKVTTLSVPNDVAFSIDQNDTAVITVRFVGEMETSSPQQTLWGQRHTATDPGPWWATGRSAGDNRYFRLYLGTSGGSWASGVFTGTGDPLESGGWCRVEIPSGDNPTVTFLTAQDSDNFPSDDDFIEFGTASITCVRSISTQDLVLGARGFSTTSESLQVELRHARFVKNGTIGLGLTEFDLARGAEGEISFPCSTGQTVTVAGNVGWDVLEWENEVEPTAIFDGQSGTNETVPDESSFDITGDLCIVAKAASNDWNSPGFNVLLSKYENSGNERSFMLTVNSTGDLRFYWCTDGTSGTVVSNDSASTGFVSGPIAQWVAVTFDADNGSGNYEVTFWTGGDGASPVWVQLGSSVVGGSVGLIYSSTSNLQIGVYSDDTSVWDGSIPYVALYNGIGDNSAPGLGTKVFERNQVDIARASTANIGDGETYLSSSGHEITSHGGITYTGEASLVIGPNESAVLGGTFIVGNQTGSIPRLVELGAGSPQPRLMVLRRETTNNVSPIVSDGVAFAGYPSGNVSFDPTEFAAYFVAVDRDADLLRNIIVRKDGTLSESTVDISSVGAINVTEGITALQALPGATGSLFFSKEFTRKEIPMLGAYLLNN